MQLNRATNATIMSAKKNASKITIMIENTPVTDKVNDKAINAARIVPIVPANKHFPFLHKQDDKAFGKVTAPKKDPNVNKISVNTPNPNAIQIETTIEPIRFNANSVPIIAANTILIMIPAQLQALQPHLSINFATSSRFICRFYSYYILCTLVFCVIS